MLKLQYSLSAVRLQDLFDGIFSEINDGVSMFSPNGLLGYESWQIGYWLAFRRSRAKTQVDEFNLAILLMNPSSGPNGT